MKEDLNIYEINIEIKVSVSDDSKRWWDKTIISNSKNLREVLRLRM